MHAQRMGIWSTLITLVWLLSTSITSAADFTAEYTARAGDLNGDGVVDSVYLQYQPKVILIPYDDLTIPIVQGKRQVGEFVLQSASGGQVTATPISSSQAAQAKSWPKVALQLLVADYNLDSNTDIMIMNLASALPGANNAIVFGPSTPGAQPLHVRTVDPELAMFFRDVQGWVQGPTQYFANAWVTQTTYIPWPVHVYDCGDVFYYEYLEGDPSEAYAILNCYYMGSYLTAVPVQSQVFDAGRYSVNAYNLTTHFPQGAVGSSTDFRLDAQGSAALRQQISNYLGVPFGRPELINGSTRIGGYWAWIKQSVLRNPALVFASMASTGNADTPDEGDVWVQRARAAIESLMRALPSGPSQEMRVEYRAADIVKIVAHHVRLAAEQGDDWSTSEYYVAERDMLARVLAQHGDKYTLAWFHHEMGEIYELYKNPAAYTTHGEAFVEQQQIAHRKTIQDQGTTPFDYYHPKVVRAHPSLFSHPGYDRARNDYDTP